MNNEGSGLSSGMTMMEQVSNALQANNMTARYPIEVAAQGATVTLTGTVDDQQAKEAAEQIARGVPGVVSVTNELVIGHDGGGLFGLGRDRDDDTAATGGADDGPAATVPAAGLFTTPAGTGSALSQGGQGAGFGAPLAAAALHDESALGAEGSSRDRDTIEADE